MITKWEFDKMEFNRNQIVIVDGKEYQLAGVDFEWRMLGIKKTNGSEITWISVINCEINNLQQYAVHRRFHIHWFKYDHDTGHNIYKKCRCGQRKVVCPQGGYQPIDQKWLDEVEMIEVQK